MTRYEQPMNKGRIMASRRACKHCISQKIKDTANKEMKFGVGWVEEEKDKSGMIPLTVFSS